MHLDLFLNYLKVDVNSKWEVLLSRPYPRLGEDRGRDTGLRLLYLTL